MPCQCILQDPVQLPVCTHHVCRQCLRQQINEGLPEDVYISNCDDEQLVKCPVYECQLQQGIFISKLKPSVLMTQILSQLKMECGFKDCKEVVKYELIEAHHKECVKGLPSLHSRIAELEQMLELKEEARDKTNNKLKRIEKEFDTFKKEALKKN